MLAASVLAASVLAAGELVDLPCFVTVNTGFNRLTVRTSDYRSDGIIKYKAEE
jgi:hypothetical protein